MYIDEILINIVYTDVDNVELVGTLLRVVEVTTPLAERSDKDSSETGVQGNS